MKLEELLGEDLYKQVQEKIDAANSGEEDKTKHIRYADLSEGGYVSKDKYNALESQYNDAQELLEKKSSEYESLKAKAGDNEALKEQIDSLQTEYENEKANMKAQYDEKLKRSAVATAIIKDYKPKDVEDVIRNIDLAKVEVSDDNITGLSEQVEELQKSKAYYFDTQSGKSSGLEHDSPSNNNIAAVRKAMGLKNNE